jgi:hypothetical protein
MVTDRTGGRYDGQDWPPPGAEFDVPAGEAKALVAQGDAVAVKVPDPPKPPDPPKAAPPKGAASTAK